MKNHSLLPYSGSLFGPGRVSVEFFFVLSGYLFIRSLDRWRELPMKKALGGMLLSYLPKLKFKRQLPVWLMLIPVFACCFSIYAFRCPADLLRALGVSDRWLLFGVIVGLTLIDGHGKENSRFIRKTQEILLPKKKRSMRYKIDLDYHIHTYLSTCSGLPRATSLYREQARIQLCFFSGI